MWFFLGWLGCAPSPLAPEVGGDVVDVLRVLPNIDDDRGDGVPDGTAPLPEDDELLPMRFRPAALRGGGLSLTVEDEGLRLWGRGELLAEGAGAEVHLDRSWEEDPVYVEVTDEVGFRGAITARAWSRRGEERSELRLPVLGSPLVLGHHLQPAEQVWVTQIPRWVDRFWNNTEMIRDYRRILGSEVLMLLEPLDVMFDVWVQDEVEIGSLSIPGQDRVAVINSVRDGGLDEFAWSLLGPDQGLVRWGDPDEATTFDSLGNLEASPPVEVDGVLYPLGRIYLGDDGTFGPVPELVEGLEAQAVQAPIHLDTSWLCVGHVDEFVSFIPDPASPKGFRVVWADPQLAYRILDDLPPDRALPRYAPRSMELGHGRATVGEIVEDRGLRAYNDEMVQEHLAPLWAQLSAELGLTAADRLGVPMLFQPVFDCDDLAGALTPGLVNLVLLDVGQGPQAILPDPFLRSDVADRSSDPFIAHVRDTFPSDLPVHFVDNWFVYHMGGGEVHCGTNERRTPDVGWWEAEHLLSMEE